MDMTEGHDRPATAAVNRGKTSLAVASIAAFAGGRRRQAVEPSSGAAGQYRACKPVSSGEFQGPGADSETDGTRWSSSGRLAAVRVSATIIADDGYRCSRW